MTDYKINLAKSIVSTPEERRRFYNGMLLYMALCAMGMVYVAYLSSLHVVEAYKADKESRMLVKTVSASSTFSKVFYKNPDFAYKQLDRYAMDLGTLRDELAKRSRFLPVIGQLFSDFPEGVSLQGLSASSVDRKVSFGLVLPLSDQEKGDPVRQLQTIWNGNEQLMGMVKSIRPITGERRMVGGQPAFFVQFECFLK